MLIIFIIMKCLIVTIKSNTVVKFVLFFTINGFYKDKS